MGDPTTLEVVVDVLTADAVRIGPGCHVAITRWGGSDPIYGVVHRVEPSAFTTVSALGVEEQRVNVIVDFGRSEEGPPPLGDGYQVEVAIIVRQVDGVHVASGAVFPLGEEWGAFVATDGRVELRELLLGERSSHRVEVLSGIQEGEAVVLYPSDALRDGARVRPRS